MAVERHPRPGAAAAHGGPQGAGADPADALGRPPGGGVPGPGGLPGEPERADRAPGPPPRQRDDPQLPARGDGPRRPDRHRRGHGPRGDPGRRGRDPRSFPDEPRDPQRQPVRLPRRRTARGAAGTCRVPAPDRPGAGRWRGGARSRCDPGGPGGRVARRAGCRRAARPPPFRCPVARGGRVGLG